MEPAIISAVQMKFCPYGGGEGRWDIPVGDERACSIGTRCDVVHYQNPGV